VSQTALMYGVSPRIGVEEADAMIQTISDGRDSEANLATTVILGAMFEPSVIFVNRCSRYSHLLVAKVAKVQARKQHARAK
jgi:hypothetical protein